jgi:hypothetical protein
VRHIHRYDKEHDRARTVSAARSEATRRWRLRPAAQGLRQDQRHRIPCTREHYRDKRCDLLDRNDRRGRICNDYIDLELDELTRDLSEALGATLRPSILDRDSTALDSAEDPARAQKSDHRHLRLLRGGHPAKKRDERAAFQSIELHFVPTSRASSQDIGLAGISQRVSEPPGLEIRRRPAAGGSATSRQIFEGRLGAGEHVGGIMIQRVSSACYSSPEPATVPHRQAAR